MKTTKTAPRDLKAIRVRANLKAGILIDVTGAGKKPKTSLHEFEQSLQ